MRIIRASDASLLITFGESISPETSKRVLGTFFAFRRKADPRIRNLHPAYTSLLVDFNPLLVSYEEIRLLAQTITMQDHSHDMEEKQRLIEIPVCYGMDLGPDLEHVAQLTGLSGQEVIEKHSSSTYLVNFLGFSPGFAYMSGLAPELRVPRLPSPRTHVLAGSVGLAGDQTGIYPVDSPGGWQIIGRTPLWMFDSTHEPPTQLQPGDLVRFVPIGPTEFGQLAERE